MKAATIAKHIAEGEFTPEEMSTLWSAIKEKNSHVNRTQAAALMAKLVPGKTRVGFGEEGRAFGKMAWKEGVVKKINQTSVQVDVNGTVWNVSASLIKVLP